DVRYAEELQFSAYNFEWANVEKLWEHLELYEKECAGLLATRPNAAQLQEHGASEEEIAYARASYPLLAAYDLCLKCSHLFNLLDARGAISVTERVGVIPRIRNLAVGVAKAYAEQQSPVVQEAKA